MAKAIIKMKFIAIQALHQEAGKFLNNYLNLHLKNLEKEEQTKHKIRGKKKCQSRNK